MHQYLKRYKDRLGLILSLNVQNSSFVQCRIGIFATENVVSSVLFPFAHRTLTIITMFGLVVNFLFFRVKPDFWYLLNNPLVLFWNHNVSKSESTWPLCDVVSLFILDKC